MFTFNVDLYYNEDSINSCEEVSAEALQPHGSMYAWGFPFMYGAFQWEPHDHMHENFGPVFDNYDYWMRWIKKVIDPKNISDWGGYIATKYQKIDKPRQVGERPNNPDAW